MSIIPKFFMEAVVALGINRLDGNKHWIGTGFLCGRKEADDPSKSTVYIITNKHVINEQNIIYVRFNNSVGIGVKDLSLALNTDYTKYYSEHSNKNIDIVAIKIIPKVITDNKLNLSYFDLDDHAITLAQMEETGVNEGSLIYALGFPMNLSSNIVKAPICRLGCISRIEDAFRAKQYAETFLVDAQTFPGNSGGPIISRPELISIQGTKRNDKANLIGILSAYIPYSDTLFSQQTGRARMVTEENSGLTIVHPVDRIKEVVELEYNRSIQSIIKSGESIC